MTGEFGYINFMFLFHFFSDIRRYAFPIWTATIN